MTLVRLTPFEEMMYYQGGEAAPCEIVFRCVFAGQIDRETFDHAVKIASSKHPVFATPIVQKRHMLYWDFASFHPPAILREPYQQQPVLGTKVKCLDLATNGLIVQVYEDPTKTVVDFRCHHSCTDGLGFYQFLEDVMAEFETKSAESNHQALRAEAVKQFKRRSRIGLSFWQKCRIVPNQIRGLRGVRHFMSRKPARLLPGPSGFKIPDHERAVRTIWHELDRDATRLYLERAKKRQSTVNDLLIHDVFLAAKDFRLARDIDPNQEEWLRFMIPINNRTEKNKIETAANMVTSIFIDRMGPTLRDSQRLLNSISEQMNLIKRNHFGLTFLISLAVFQKIPGGLKKQAADRTRKPSGVVSNLGRVMVDPSKPAGSKRSWGDVTLEGLQVALPVEGNTSFGVFVTTYAGKMSLSLCYDAEVIAPGSANDLMKQLLKQMKQDLA